MKHRHWFWGLFLLAAAVFVIGSQVGAFIHLGFWSLAVTVLLVAIIIRSAVDLNYFGIFIPIAFLYSIYDHIFHWRVMSIWLLLLAAVLASAGCEVLFHRQRRWCHGNGRGSSRYSSLSEGSDDSHPYAKVSFGASSQYLHGDCVESGEFVCSFGELGVFFDQAVLSPRGADIMLDCRFGAIKVFVPRLWHVQDNVRASLGAVQNERTSPPNPDGPVLRLNGSVQFGAIEIHYV